MSKSKWSPFNAVADGDYMIDEVLEKKNKMKMPILSDDQKEQLQSKMVEAFHNQETIRIKFFMNGSINVVEGKITNIDSNSRKITLNSNFFVYFSQIIDFF